MVQGRAADFRLMVRNSWLCSIRPGCQPLGWKPPRNKHKNEYPPRMQNRPKSEPHPPSPGRSPTYIATKTRAPKNENTKPQSCWQ
jgi:hypothetical protein